jgi:hypothetical protein
MMNYPVGRISKLNSGTRAQTLSYFTFAVLGFSFWFFLAVPFASHRESYSWLAGVHSQSFTGAFAFISVTYRPLAQGTAWLGFLILNPSVFPTSVVRQALLQGFIYGMFLLAWWLIYSAAAQRRLFAFVALVAGGVFFSGYVHLFHIYGVFYVPVMMMLGVLLRFFASSALDKREARFAVVATVLAFWHPFATALFVGFYFGFYLDTFRQRTRAQHVQAVVILLVGTIAIAALVFLFPRPDAIMSLQTRLFGLLESYRTSEVNRVASVVAFLLTQFVVFTMGCSLRLRLMAFLLASALSAVFFLASLPLLFLWVGAVLWKLFHLRCWSLFFLALTAALFPFGGGIGAPVFSLFAIVVAAYVTPLGWSRAENALSFVEPRYVVGAIMASAIVLLMVRIGIDIPIVTTSARPLLTERERTYQLESILAWLGSSDYCGYEIAFAENAGSPIDSVENVITRRNRPPAALEDVRFFWDTVLRCHRGGDSSNKTGRVLVTFGAPPVADSMPVFKVRGTYAGDATLWVASAQK